MTILGGTPSESAPERDQKCKLALAAPAMARASDDPRPRILDLAREAVLADRLGEAQAHQRIARRADEIIAQLDHAAVLAVIEPELLEPIGEMLEHSQPPG